MYIFLAGVSIHQLIAFLVLLVSIPTTSDSNVTIAGLYNMRRGRIRHTLTTSRIVHPIMLDG
jgi:hypothetical protein